jgi:hypothetical protein
LNAQALLCPKCRDPLPEALFNQTDFTPCPRCGRKIHCEVFPAYYSGPRVGSPGEALVDSSEASCFFHPEKKAIVACESCGRFLCALCDLEFGGRHICPSCLTATRRKGALGNFDHFRLSWPGLALLLSIVPLLFYPITFVTAPAAVVVGLIGLRKPPSLTGQRRILMVVFALLFAVGQIVAWFFLFKTIFKKQFGG